MRLLNTSTFQLEIFESELARPPYAILSHTWGTDEVLFDDVSARSLDLLSITRKGGRAKVIGSCREARRNGYRLRLNRHLLHLQEQQLRALRGNQLHVQVVSCSRRVLCVYYRRINQKTKKDGIFSRKGHYLQERKYRDQ